MDEGCSCHINPPCNWCVSLTEEEADLFASGGVQAVLKHREAAEAAEPDDRIGDSQ
jgi:hypothetical protein